VQSAVDGCNLPQEAATLFHGAGGGYFLELTMAHHFSPYIGLGPAAPIVERVTAAFLKAAPDTSDLNGLTLSATSLTGTTLAKLYPPSKPPTLASLPLPTQTELAAACAVPSAP
jgi:hypothetical protein